MITNDYRYAISLCREDGTTLAQIPVDIDWEPATEWGRLSGIRCGRLSAKGQGLSTTVEPIWHPEVGKPYLNGFHVHLKERTGKMKCELPVSYCRAQARQLARHLMEKGILGENESFRYFVLAHRLTDKPDARSTELFAVEPMVTAIPLSASKLECFVHRAELSGPEIESDDIPVFIPKTVVEEVSELTKQAGTKEAGGMLIGYVHQDQSVPEVFLEVTAQISAIHTEASTTKLTFTAETWSAMQACLSLRGKRESVLGWWHCHNYMKDTCKDCQKARDNSCKASALFMSPDDCALHRLCFPKAYSIALVVADGPCTGLTWGLFGWKCGSICHRGFHILNPAASEQSELAVNTSKRSSRHAEQ